MERHSTDGGNDRGYLAQIHSQRLKDQTQVLLMEKMPKKSHAVVLVVGIGIIELSKDFQFLEPRFVPGSGT